MGRSYGIDEGEYLVARSVRKGRLGGDQAAEARVRRGDRERSGADCAGKCAHFVPERRFPGEFAVLQNRHLIL